MTTRYHENSSNTDSKSGIPATVSGVRIPLSPVGYLTYQQIKIRSPKVFGPLLVHIQFNFSPHLDPGLPKISGRNFVAFRHIK